MRECVLCLEGKLHKGHRPSPFVFAFVPIRPAHSKCSVNLGNEQFTRERIQHKVGQIVRFYDVHFAKEESHLGMSS